MLNKLSKVPKKALLIGISYDAWPKYELHLPGCLNDVANAKKFLLQIGMEEKNIRVLTDDDELLAPTKAAILKEFEWVQDGAEPGDVLYIHFSGHGVETDPPSDNPLDKASSKAICPIDIFHENPDDIQVSSSWKDYNSLTFVNPITGEDFKNVFGHLTGSLVNLTVVYDCCHSTGAMRALGGPSEAKSRGLPVPRAHRKLLKQVAKKTEELGDNNNASITRGVIDKTFDQRYAPEELVPPYVIGFAAAQGWESAQDVGGNGVFSYYFYALLRKEVEKINGQGIIDSVNKSIKALEYKQISCLTTSKALLDAPLFIDLSAPKKRSLGGGDSEKLSATRDIVVDDPLPSMRQLMVEDARANIAQEKVKSPNLNAMLGAIVEHIIASK